MIEVFEAPAVRDALDNKTGYAFTKKVQTMFLAGTIDMGNSEDWQAQVISEMEQTNIGRDKEFTLRIFNPRRRDFQKDAAQTMENEYFYEQVMWEQTFINISDIIFFNFLPDSKSPVTMMELGEMVKHTGKNDKAIIVVCPKEFWRRGNVEVFCKEVLGSSANAFVKFCETFDEGLAELRDLTYRSPQNGIRHSEI